jgi:mRNA interferase RelE/StbE
MTYTVVVNKKALKTLVKINEPYYSSVKAKIYSLGDNPRPHGYIKLKDRPGYPIRVGDYRIIYEIIDKILVVEVIDLGNRKEIYG